MALLIEHLLADPGREYGQDLLRERHQGHHRVTGDGW
jgi:hypothetical protein